MAERPTARNLRQGLESPLVEFVGDLVQIPYEATRVTYPGQVAQDKTRVTFRFNNVRVIESTSPWPFPTAEISILFSAQERSRWGILANSALVFLQEEEDILDLAGATGVHMKKTVGHDLGEDRQGVADPVTGKRGRILLDCWEIMAIEGRVATGADNRSPEDQVLEMLDGADITEFNRKVMTSPVVRSNPALQASILNQTFIAARINEGRATVDDDGIYHVIPF